MTLNCETASKSAELCCWLLCKGLKFKDVQLIVIENEFGGTKFFFQKCPYFVKEGRWENKIKYVPN